MSGSILLLGALGGLISFFSTSLGAILSLRPFRFPRFVKFKFSIDFALGLMLSAVAFSLVAPAANQSASNPRLLFFSLIAFAIGGFVIYSIKVIIQRTESEMAQATSSQLVLALALIIHNFPEGLASGASLAGLSSSAAAPILTSIALQNIPEGLLMVLCLKSLGWTQRHAFLGGLGSGVVELVGGIVAGLALGWTSGALPLILMMAGGAMFTSVVIEIREKGSAWTHVRKPEFALGLLSIPFLNFLVG